MPIHPETTFLTHVDPFGKVWVTLWEEDSQQAVAYDDIAQFENDPSQYIVDWATSQLEDFSPIALGHAVKQFYLEYGSAEEKRVYGVDVRPYSGCTDCGHLIHFEDGEWYDEEDDRSPEVKPACTVHDGGIPHQPRWLTLGELRFLTKDLPDNTPITAYSGNLAAGNEWVNVAVTAEAVSGLLNEEQPSLILDLRDDFDTRQW